MELLEKLELFTRSSEDYIQTNEELKLDPKDIIEALGGEKYFKKNFKRVRDAMKFIEKNLKEVMDSFNMDEDDISTEEIRKYLNKIL